MKAHFLGHTVNSGGGTCIESVPSQLPSDCSDGLPFISYGRKEMTAIEEQHRVCVGGGVGRIEGAAQGWGGGGEWDALRNTSVINVIINLYI